MELEKSLTLFRENFMSPRCTVYPNMIVYKTNPFGASKAVIVANELIKRLEVDHGDLGIEAITTDRSSLFGDSFLVHEKKDNEPNLTSI